MRLIEDIKSRISKAKNSEDKTKPVIPSVDYLKDWVSQLNLIVLVNLKKN